MSKSDCFLLIRKDEELQMFTDNFTHGQFLVLFACNPMQITAKQIVSWFVVYSDWRYHWKRFHVKSPKVL